MLFDRSDRLRMKFTGPKAADSLTGLVTNDVLALQAGEGQYACALTPKGRVIADVRILAIGAGETESESLLVDTNPAAGPGFAAMIRKYVNPRLAKYADVTTDTACLTLAGAAAAGLLEALGASAEAIADVRDGAMFTHRATWIATHPVRVARVPDLGSVFDLHLNRSVSDEIVQRLVTDGAVLSDAAEWHRRRVVATRPEWGIDFDENTLAQEANMDALDAISYRKGCYTGQETVARVHFRGHVNRTLRRVMYPDGVHPARGTPLLTEDLTAVGDARSVAASDDGSLVGIAMLRRETADGASLVWRADDGRDHRVIVTNEAASD
jgi:tRNA-modifying protein YgfZ